MDRSRTIAPPALAGVRPHETLEKLARVGFACKGVVYVLLGGLALMAALREGGETTDKRGVIENIAYQPLGEVALAVMAAGLLGYAAWRLLSAYKDSDGAGSDLKGMGKRAGDALSGFVYAGVALYAIQLLIGNGGSSGDERTWTARLLQAPGGPLIVMGAGILVIAAGGYQIYKGLTKGFLKRLRLDGLSSQARTWAIRSGKWGYTARGVIFVIMGFALTLAGLNSNPSEAKGMEAALDTLASEPYGSWLLGFVALGLAFYGAFSIVEARYRRLRT